MINIKVMGLCREKDCAYYYLVLMVIANRASGGLKGEDIEGSMIGVYV